MTSFKGQNKVIYALACSYSMFIHVVLYNKHCRLVLTVFHMVNINLQIKTVLHARVIEIACCRIVGLMHIGAYTDH